MNNTHGQSSLHQSDFPKRKIVAFFTIAATLIACGTIIWVLNIVGIIPGPWSNVFGAIFTGIGIIVALLNCLLSLAPARERKEDGQW